MKKLALTVMGACTMQAWAQFVAEPAPHPSNVQNFQTNTVTTEQHFQNLLTQVQALAHSDEMKKIVEEGKALTNQVQTEFKRDASEILGDVARMAQNYAQQVNPDRAPNAAPKIEPQKINPNLQGIAYVKQLPHGSLVQVHGVITGRVAGDNPVKYWFSDGREQVMVEIEHEVWRNQKVTPSTQVQLWAEVERVRATNGFKELEVDYLQVVKP